jgi:hypothetical protein
MVWNYCIGSRKQNKNLIHQNPKHKVMPIITTPPNVYPLQSAYFNLEAALHQKMTLPTGTLLHIDVTDFDSHPQCNFNMARELVDDGGTVENANGQWVLTQPFTGSPSACKVLVSGTAGNGWRFWHINEPGHPFHGQVIDELRNAPQPQQAVNPQDEARAGVEPGMAAEGGVPPQIQRQPAAGIGLALPSHASIREFFLQAGRLHLLCGAQAWDAGQWPQGFGVYLVWHVLPDSPRKLLYIGKAGKYRRMDENEAELNGGNLAHRLGRWTPYCFQSEGPFANHLEYVPNAGVNHIRMMPYEDRYQQHVPAAQIEVECFSLFGWETWLAPALLEAAMLQAYLAENGDLPPANNEF